jgi:hypothetical protein
MTRAYEMLTSWPVAEHAETWCHCYRPYPQLHILEAKLGIAAIACYDTPFSSASRYVAYPSDQSRGHKCTIIVMIISS